MAETALLCWFAFLAGVVDAVAGGAGLIQVPALFVVFPGATPVLLLGINKMSSIVGTAAAAVRYAASVPIQWHSLRLGALLALFTAAAGAAAVTVMDPSVLPVFTTGSSVRVPEACLCSVLSGGSAAIS